MLPIVEIPKLVEHYSLRFESLFTKEGFMYFQRYLSGLIISENKTVQGINQHFVIEPRDQSRLNRFLNTSKYDLEVINKKRIDLLQSNPKTAFKKGKDGGVLSIDDTLLEHYGKKMDHIGYIWDHVKHHSVLAHNVVNFHYSDNQTDYPLDFTFKIPVDVETLEKALEDANVHLNEKHQANKLEKTAKWRQYLLSRWGDYQYKKPELQKVYISKLMIAKDFLKNFVDTYPELNLPVCFDSWFTKPAFIKYVDEDLKLSFVAGIALKEMVILKGSKQLSLGEFALQLKTEHTKEQPVFKPTTFNYKGKKQTFYTYHKVHRIKNFDKRLLMISYTKEDLSGKARCFICNRHQWHAKRLSYISRHRWPVEVFHQEGKVEGLDKYQLRNFKAIKRHYAFVVMVYSILELARNDSTFLDQLQENFKADLDGSIAHWRRRVKASNLLNFVNFLALALKNGQSIESILQPFLKAIAF